MNKNIFIHNTSIVESKDIGKGTKIWEFCHILPDTKIGMNCNICAYCFIENGVRVGNNVTIKNGVSLWKKVSIEDNVFIGPDVVFTNDLNPRAEIKKGDDELLETVVKNGCTIGANSTILCGIVLGNYSFIAAGSVITRDITDYALMMGNPAKQAGYMCQCGKRMIPDSRCDCGRIYRVNENDSVYLID